MKKKLLAVLFTVAAAACLCFGLAGCGKETPKPSGGTEQGGGTHTHSFTNYVYNEDATCEKDGTETGTCACGESDTRPSAEHLAFGHDYTVENKCERCGSVLKPTEGLVYTYIPEADGYSVKSSDRSLTGELVIPYGHDHKPVVAIADEAFYNCSRLTGTLEIPDSVTSIGDCAFRGCSGLTGELKIPDSVTSIGDSAFLGCSGLTSITIPDGVTSIGSYAFYFCSGFTGTLKIPDSVTSIGDYAFHGCSGLTGTLEIPNGVTSIGWSAFYGCKKLENIIWNAENCSEFSAAYSYYYYKHDEANFRKEVFFGCTQLKTVTFGKDVKTIPTREFRHCSGLERMMVDAENQEYSSRDGILYDKAQTQLLFIPLAYHKTLTVPSTVTSLGDDATYGCSGIEHIEVEAGNSAYLCEQDCLILPRIGKIVVLGCKNSTFFEELEDIPVKIIQERAFIGCSGLTTITLPDSLTTICENAFCGCSGLESVTLGSGVIRISEYAFSGCSKLESVYYKGTPSQWSTIYIEDYNSALTKATRYYFSDQMPTEEQWSESSNWWHYEENSEKILIWSKESA